MATPNTVGVAAEVLSHFPNLTNLELKKVLMDTVSTGSRYTNKMVSNGRVNLLSALENAESLQDN